MSECDRELLWKRMRSTRGGHELGERQKKVYTLKYRFDEVLPRFASKTFNPPQPDNAFHFRFA